MERISKNKTRALDLVAAGILLCLVADGYAAGGYRHRPHPCHLNIKVGVLVLASFVGVFYSFRLYMRLVWMIAVPLCTVVIPVLGTELFMRLNRSPGHEDAAQIGQSFGLLTCYLGFLLCWSFVRLLGWRLHGEACVIRDQTGLYELLAITAFLAVLIAVARTLPLAMIFAACLVARWVGFRLVRGADLQTQTPAPTAP